MFPCADLQEMLQLLFFASRDANNRIWNLDISPYRESSKKINKYKTNESTPADNCLFLLNKVDCVRCREKRKEK